MGELSYNSGLLKRYLLGALSPDQQDSVEEKYFTENDIFIKLLDAEDQLIDDYLSGRLSADDRARFERHYLTLPDRRREIELARFFRAERTERPVAEPATPLDRTRAWLHQWLGGLRAKLVLTGAAAALVLVAGSSGLLVMWQFQGHSPGSVASNTTEPERSSVITLELSPGLSRGTGEAPKAIPKAVKAARTRAIELKLAAGSAAFLNYRGKLQRIEVEAVDVLASNTLQWEQTTIGERIVTWEISADNLPSGDYQVNLEGINADDSTESIGTYHFKIAEK